MNKTVGVVLVVLLLIGLVWYFADDDQTISGLNTSNNTANTGVATSNGTAPNGTNTGSTDPLSDGNRVLLRETTAGNSVVIQSTALLEPGYVVIYRSEQDGSTKLIGQTRLLQPGEYNNVTVNLSESIQTGQSVVAVLHADDGDGSFEVPGADAYLGNPGVPIVNDADIVGTPFSEEPPEFEEQVETYLDDEGVTTTTSE